MTDPIRIKPKLIKTKAGKTWYDMERVTFMKFSRAAGAVVKFGGSIWHDTEKLDDYIDTLRDGGDQVDT